MSLNFEILESSGIFQYNNDDTGEDAIEVLDSVLERNDAGGLRPTNFTAELQNIVTRYPDFIDGHAHLGYALWAQGKFKAALSAYLCDLDVGESVIPLDFQGHIEWSYIENRPFLRAIHGAVLCYLRLRQRQKALSLMERILAYNPNDNQGVRDLIGPEYLRSGEVEKARAIFESEAGDYPPYRYELALLLLREGSFISAATSLRRGFVANGYIAEMLQGNPNPVPLAIWHGSNFAEPEIAHGYVVRSGDLWRRTPDALAFLRWLYNHPKILAERAAVLEWREKLLWEHDYKQRGLLLEKESAALETIDDRLSEEIVGRRLDRYGRQVLPWLYQERRPRLRV